MTLCLKGLQVSQFKWKELLSGRVASSLSCVRGMGCKSFGLRGAINQPRFLTAFFSIMHVIKAGRQVIEVASLQVIIFLLWKGSSYSDGEYDDKKAAVPPGFVIPKCDDVPGTTLCILKSIKGKCFLLPGRQLGKAQFTALVNLKQRSDLFQSEDTTQRDIISRSLGGF